MALFGSKTKKTEKSEAPASVDIDTSARDMSHILMHARITEKATMHQSTSVYTFDVATRATKRDVIRAVQSLYKVTPRMVRMVTIPLKEVRHARTGKTGMKGGGKKAYVYLKSGETITIG
jgi:ribosomal protein L23